MDDRYEMAWRDRKRRMVVFKTTQIVGIGVIFGVLFWMWRESSVSNPPALRPLLLIPVWLLAAAVNSTVVAGENLTVGGLCKLPAEDVAPGR